MGEPNDETRGIGDSNRGIKNAREETTLGRFGASTTGRVPLQRRGQMSKSRVLNTSTEEQIQTLVLIKIVGHASPRWQSAKSKREADRRNMILSRKRANAVRAKVEELIRAELPGGELIFKYEFTPAKPREEVGSAIVSTEGRGSRETLRETRSRSANDLELRRVNLSIDMSFFTDTSLISKIEDTKLEPAATRKWGISLGLAAKTQFIAGGGVYFVKLYNRKSRQEVQGTIIFASLGLAAKKASIKDFEVGASISWGDWVYFKTDKAVNFSDFDYARASLVSSGFDLALIGGEVKYLNLADVAGTNVDFINVSGWNSGGIGLNPVSVEAGTLYVDAPPGSAWIASKSYRTEYDWSSSVSPAPLESIHSILFPTGQSTIESISTEQKSDLMTFVRNTVYNYRNQITHRN